jgi:hypothetical protein
MRIRKPLLFLGCFLTAAGMALTSAQAASDRMYFTGLVEQNLDTAVNQVLLSWGPLEREVPQELTGFRLYRRPVPGAFVLVEEIQREVADAAAIQAFFEEQGEGLRRDDIQQWAFDISGGTVTGTAVYAYLHDILSITQGSPSYNPLRTLYLARMNLDAGRSLGLAAIDRNALPAGNFEYMLTGLEGTTETLPLGKCSVDTTAPTVLPSPPGFEQVFLGGCSLIGKGLDDRRVHFRWDIPSDPARLGLRVVIYGYDLFRSDANLGLGPADIRNMQIAGSFNPALTKVNHQPIIATGAAPMQGKDAFLAIDQGDAMNGQYLQRGRTYYYYLVARDLSGKYSRMAPAVEALVPDALAPPAPWGVRTEEIKDPVMTTVPRIQLVWDEIEKGNYVREFGSHRIFPPAPSFASPSELYFVPQGEPVLPQNLRDVDLDVDRYLVFRFDTQEKAQKWGVDSDLDYWPDEIEEASGTDKCDETSHPAGNPPELASIIPISDAMTVRTLGNGSKQRFYIDHTPSPDNHVYWYRLLAIDQFDNQSPLSPPVRGVLWDRTQPSPEAVTIKERCTYRVERDPNCQPGSIVRVRGNDQTRTRKAAKVCLYEVCGRDPAGGGETSKLIFIYEKPMKDGQADILVDELSRITCNPLCPGRQGGAYILRFYDARGRLLGTSELFTGLLCQGERTDCFILKEFCEPGPTHPGETLDPGESVQICVVLKPGERARVFHEINGQMSAFATIHAPTSAASPSVYCITEDLTAIVPAGACLGVRVFSKNNVGSYIKYLNCLTIPSGTPETPLMHSVDPIGTNLAPKFTVRWAAQEEGLSAFVLAMKVNGKVRYNTYWIMGTELNYSNGLYEVTLDLNPATDLNREWCFQVRAIDKALKSSGWSPSLCETWEPEPGEHLPWPPVPETTQGTGITAYFLGAPLYPQPVLVLSDDLTGRINRDDRCDINYPDCRETAQGKVCLQPLTFFCTGLCDELRTANNYGKFIVYRQEQDKDFVQVSPLIDTFWCYRFNQVGASTLETLDDPFIFLAQPDPGLILPASIRPEVLGPRLIFADNYPCRRGSKVRYQVMVVDPSTGEGTAMHYSNWLDIP